MNMGLAAGLCMRLLLIYISMVYQIDLLAKYQNWIPSLEDTEIIDFRISYSYSKDKILINRRRNKSSKLYLIHCISSTGLGAIGPRVVPRDCTDSLWTSIEEVCMILSISDMGL
jgi:hypothetical protein